MLEAGLIASRFLHYIAVLSLFGAALYPLYAFRGRLAFIATEQAALVVSLRRTLLLTLVAALVSGFGWFEFTTATMADSADAMMKPGVLMTMMMGTDFGPLWAGRLILLIIAAALLLWWPSKFALWLVPICAALLLASLAGTGHARVTEGWAGTLHIAADCAHLLAAGLWLGGLWPLGAVIAASFRASGVHGEALPIAEVLRRFSGVATLAVAILVASGLVNSWFLVGSIGALFSSVYGWLLDAKLGLFLVMAMLAAANRFWITPRLEAAPSSQDLLKRLRRHVVAEQGLGLLVLTLVGILGTLEPPASG